MSENQSSPDAAVPERIVELLHCREAICQKLSECAADDSEQAQAIVDDLQSQWNAAPEIPPEYAEILDRRYQEALKAFADSRAAAEERRQAAAAAAAKASAAAAALQDLSLAPKISLAACEKAKKEYERHASGAAAEVAAMAAEAIGTIDARLSAVLAAAEASAAALDELAAKLNTMLAAEDPAEFKKARPELEKARDAALESADAEHPAVASAAAKVREAMKKLNAQLTLHYQTLDLARWESYTLKLDICRELEELNAYEDSKLSAAANRLRELRKAYQELGAVPREKQQEIGPKYYELTTKLQRRVDDYFKALRARRNEAAEAKKRICEAAEALADSTEWNATGEKLKALQLEWKNAGSAGREQDTALYARFRVPCDQFFAARNAYWETRRTEQNSGAEQRRALCEAAEALSSMETGAAVARARQLRGEYQSAPRAGRQEPELNARFNAAMDAFFGSLRSASDQARGQRDLLIGKLNSAGADLSAVALEQLLHEVRGEWAALPAMRREEAGRFEAKFRSACTALEKKISAARKKMLEERGAYFVPAMRAAVACCRAALREEALPEVTEDLSAFPKLAAAVTDLIAEGGKMPEGMQRALVRNTRDFAALLDEYESLSLPASEEKAERDLAQELALAIAGNFASADFAPAKKKSNPGELKIKMQSIGVLDPEKAEALLDRYEALS